MSPTAAVPRTGAAHGRIQRSRRSWRRLGGGVIVTLTVGAVAIAAVTLTRAAGGLGDPQCTVAAAGSSYMLTPEQAANAAIISAVAVRQGLPNHAATIALATALQETKLRNLDYGDRDSLGLFQQRPSQGWGSAMQVQDPNYAAGAFYRALVKLPNWQTDSVATAAQEVQRSADGSAYASWEGEARALASALTGEVPAGLTCSGKAPTSTGATTARVSAAVAAAFGAQALTPGSDTTLGRAGAAWLVANCRTYGITRVAYAGYAWDAVRGTWVTDRAAGATVEFTLALPRSA